MKNKLHIIHFVGSLIISSDGSNSSKQGYHERKGADADFNKLFIQRSVSRSSTELALHLITTAWPCLLDRASRRRCSQVASSSLDSTVPYDILGEFLLSFGKAGSSAAVNTVYLEGNKNSCSVMYRFTKKSI